MDDFDSAFADLVPTEEDAFADLVPPARTKSEQVWRGLGLFSRSIMEGAAKIPAGAADLASSTGNFAGNLIGRADASLTGREFTPQEYFPTGNVEHLESQYNRFMPSPETRPEQYAMEATEFGVGASSGVGAGRAMASSSSDLARRVGAILRDAPGTQVAAGGLAATASNMAEDMGAGPVGQAAAGVAGGFVTPVAGVAATRTVSGIGRTAAGVKDALTRSGQRKIAGNVLDDAALDPRRARENIAEYERSTTNISERTTGEASRDPGLLSVERVIRNMDDTGRFSQRMSQANEARHKILDIIGGEDVAAMKASRDAATKPLREAALTPDPAVKTAPVVERIDTLLATPSVKGQKTVTAALNEFRDRIANAKTGQELYGIRKDINLAMGGKLSGDRQDYRFASSQLAKIKDGIDQAIEAVAPGWRKYLSEYARMSKEIDQQEIIQGFRKARLATSDPMTGRDVLSQAKFRNMLEKEIQNGTLSDEQISVLQAISDDLDIGASINAATVRPSGSDTAKNLSVAHIIGRAMGGYSDHPAIMAMAKPLKWLTSYSDEQVQGILVEAMLEPRLARILMEEAKPAQIHRFNRALSEIMGVSAVGSTTGSLPDAQKEPE